MAALTTLNITEKNANNSLSVTVKVNVTKEGVFTTTLSKMEVAMNFIKEAYPFNEETESFIRKKFDMPMPDESKE